MGTSLKFLLKIADKFQLTLDDFKTQDTDFKLVGLPFYNEGLKERFKEGFHQLIAG